jgi:2-keto-4-pentenoate hydratase
MDLQALANRHLSDYDQRSPGQLFADSNVHLTVEQAYDLQFQVAQLRQQRGEQIAGYKIGCISRTMQTQLGLDRPVFGHVWASELHRSGVVLSPSDYDHLAIEGEFAIRAGPDPRRPEIEASVLPIIELHHYVFRGRAELRAAELIANNAIHAGVVLPDRETLLRDGETLSAAVLRVYRNGSLIGEAAGRVIDGGPLAGVRFLAEHLARYGRQLLPGQLILTGSPLPLWPVAAGDQIEVHCADLDATVRASVAG